VAFKLEGVDVDILPGQLTMVIGRVGTGLSPPPCTPCTPPRTPVPPPLPSGVANPPRAHLPSVLSRMPHTG
jgi:hypothetical protein